MMETETMVDSGLKLTCSREDFVSRLAVVSRAVSTRSSVQILAGVLLRAEGGELHLTFGARNHDPIGVHRAGEVPARGFERF